MAVSPILVHPGVHDGYTSQSSPDHTGMSRERASGRPEWPGRHPEQEVPRKAPPEKAPPEKAPASPPTPEWGPPILESHTPLFIPATPEASPESGEKTREEVPEHDVESVGDEADGEDNEEEEEVLEEFRLDVPSKSSEESLDLSSATYLVIKYSHPFYIPPIDEVRFDFDGPEHPFRYICNFLFETSPVVQAVWSILHMHLSTDGPARLESYTEVVTFFSILLGNLPGDQEWYLPQVLQAHGRIDDLATMSTVGAWECKENAQTNKTIEKRIRILRQAYEERYPDLTFVTFIDGRPRMEIVFELEEILEYHSQSLQPFHPEPTYMTTEWYAELHRGLDAAMTKAISRARRWGGDTSKMSEPEHNTKGTPDSSQDSSPEDASDVIDLSSTWSSPESDLMYEVVRDEVESASSRAS